MALFAIVLVMWFAPKIATVIDVLTRPSCGGLSAADMRFIAGVVTEMVFFLLLVADHVVRATRCSSRGLLFGRSVGWTVQARDDHAVPWSLALRQLWPHTLLGLCRSALLAPTVPAAIPYALVHRRRAAAVDSARGRDRLAAKSAAGCPDRAWPPAGGNRAAAGDAALWRCRRSSCARHRQRPSPEAMRDAGAPGAASSVRCASTTATASARAAMDRLYRGFVQPGDLVFDVGAHVGDRIAAFRRLGARVVAVEPQPALVRTLKLLYGRDPAVTIERLPSAATPARSNSKLNVDNPTVSTASTEFIDAAGGAPGWEGQAWSRSVQVPLTTLDALIARHGLPAFIKIDVEGFEAEALAGLTQPPPRAVVRIHHHPARVGRPASNVVANSAMCASTRRSARARPWCIAEWQKPTAIAWLAAQRCRSQANSGDVYASRELLRLRIASGRARGRCRPGAGRNPYLTDLRSKLNSSAGVAGQPRPLP